MATVAITPSLKDRLANRIDRARDAEIQANYPDHYHRADIKLVDVAELHNRLQWGEHYEVGMKLPRDWLAEDTHPCIRVTDNQWMENRTVTTTVQFHNVAGTRIRPSQSYYNSVQAELIVGRCEHLSHLAGYRELIDRLDQAKGAQLISDRWRSVKENVFALMDKCKSLNEAVKLQPSLKAFLSADDIERLERKTVRAKRETNDILEGVDLDAITTGAVLVRLS